MTVAANAGDGVHLLRAQTFAHAVSQFRGWHGHPSVGGVFVGRPSTSTPISTQPPGLLTNKQIA
jgi:hypothetical protein